MVGPPQAVTFLGKDMTQFLPLFSGLQYLYVDFDSREYIRHTCFSDGLQHFLLYWTTAMIYMYTGCT